MEMSGILLPQLPYRWRLRVPSLAKEQADRLTTQAQIIKIDYKNKRLVITLMQDAVDTLLHEAIIMLIEQSNTALFIDSLDGANSPSYMLEFDGEVTSHNFEFNYGQRDPLIANHTIEFEYTTMTPYNQTPDENVE